MATVTTLGFSIFSKFNGKGVIAAKKALADLAKQRPTVVVEARVEKALADIHKVSAAVDKLKTKSASVKVTADTDQAHSRIRALAQEMNRLKSKSATVNVHVDGALANIARVKAELATLHDKTITIHVNTDTDRVGRLASLLRRVGDEGNNTNRRLVSGFNSTNVSANRVIKSFDAFQGSQMAMLRLALLLGPAAVGGLGAAGVAAHQALVALSAAAGGAGVFALALKNVAAITDSQVRVQIDRAKSAFKSFGTGSAALLGQVMVHAVNAFINVLHLIEPAVRPVTKVFLAIAKEVEGFTKSPGAIAFMGWFKTMAPIAITSLWGTFKVLANGMYHFLARIGAFNGQVFLDWLNRTAHAFNTWANGEGPVKLKRFFDQWGPVLVQAAKGLLQLAFAMGKALNPVVIILVGWLGRFSMWLGKLIEQHPWLGKVIAGVILGYRLLATTVAIVASVQSVLTAKIVRNTAAWIANKAVIVAHKVATAGSWLLGLALSLARMTGRLIANTAAWVANRAQVVASKAAAAGGWLLGVISAIGRQTAALLRNTAAWIANRVQVVLSRAVAAGAWMAAMVGAINRQTAALVRNTFAWIANRAQVLASRAIAIAGVIYAAAAALAVQTVQLIRNAAVWLANRIAVIAYTVVSLACAAATRVMAIAQRALNIAMLSNPYVLVAALLIALVVAIVVAYKKSETFRRIVQACFHGIAAAGKFMWYAVIKPIISLWIFWFKLAWVAAQLFWKICVAAFRYVAIGAMALWNAIKVAFGAIARFIAAVWARVVSVLRGPWNATWNFLRRVVSSAWAHIRTTVSAMGSGIRSAFNAMRSGIGRAWSAVWNFVRGILSSAWSHIRTTVASMAGWMAGAFRRIRSAVGGVWNATWGWMRSAFNFAWGKIRGSIAVMGQWLGNKFRAIRNSIGGWWNRAWSWIRSIFNFAWGKIRGSIHAMGQWLGNKFHSIRNSIGGWWNRAWTWIRAIFNFAWGKIRGSVHAMGQWLGNKFHSIRNSIGSWWNKAWTWIRNIFNFAWGKLHGSIHRMGQWLGNKFHSIRNSIGSWWNKAWTWIRAIFNFAWGKIRGSMHLAGQWMGNKFHAIYSSLTSWWNKMWARIRAIFNFAWGKVRGSMHVMAKTMAGIWHGIVNTAGHIFNGIKKAVGRPINTVIGFVQTLAKLADKALSLVGVKSNIFGAIKGWKVTGYNQGGIVGVDKPTMGFAMGGLMPGYSPGRDNLVAPSPIGPVGLSGGEGILRPEVMRAPGMKEFLYTANRKARSGGIHGVKNMVAGGPSNGADTFKAFNVAPAFQNPNGGFAKGGLVAKFDGGGIFDKIKGALSAASHFIPGIGSMGALFKGGKKIFETTGFDMIVDKAIGKLMDKTIGAVMKLGPFGSAAGQIGRKVVDAIVNYVVGKTTPVSTDGDPFYKNPSKRLQHALSWAKSQAGKPYQWGGGGNPSYDCSGFMASIQRVINGQGPGRLYTTHDFRGKSAPKGWKQDAASPFMVGVTDAGVGHMAGTLINNHVESAGSRGVNVGPKARGAFDKLFKWHYGYMPVAKDATLVGGGNGKGGPMAGTIGKSGEAWVGTFWDTGSSGYGDTGAPASGKKMHKFALASRRLIPYGKTAIMQAFGQKRMAAFESIDYGPGITSRLFDIDTYGAAWLFGKEKAWSASNPGRDVSPGVFRVHWKKGYGQGGNIPGGQLSLVGERGAEVMMPNRGQKVFKSGSTVSVGDTHVHFHDKVYAKSEREFRDMVVTAISEAKRKKKI